MPQYIVESYRRDVCFHRARVNANSDAEARNEAPTVAAPRRRALVHEARRWCAYLWFVVYLMRIEIGMPELVIRLRTAHPILASVF
jgi:hypothetical protein